MWCWFCVASIADFCTVSACSTLIRLHTYYKYSYTLYNNGTKCTQQHSLVYMKPCHTRLTGETDFPYTPWEVFSSRFFPQLWLLLLGLYNSSCGAMLGPSLGRKDFKGCVLRERHWVVSSRLCAGNAPTCPDQTVTKTKRAWAKLHTQTWSLLCVSTSLFQGSV